MAPFQDRYDAVVGAAAQLLVGLDFDGTLSPIVEDPEEAHIHPDAGPALADLADVVAAIAVITGRPARQALALGGLDEVGNSIGEAGKELHLFGQYGFERWSSTNRRIVSPRPPKGLSTFLGRLPAVLKEHDADGAFVEDKGLAVAVHTRRLPDAAGAFDRLLPVLTELADDNGLKVEPGRQVIEVRSPGMDKGQVVRSLVEELSAGAFLFAGDDLGDFEAFEAVAALRDEGMPTLLVCSLSSEESALLELADVAVRGPEGVLDLLRQLTRDARGG
jgi:trehalose 6-phosphate phosphatase